MKIKFEMECFKKCSFSLSTFTVVIIGIVVVIFAFCAFYYGYFPNPKDDSANVALILSFVGILATFIVVSNYAQTKDIQREFSEKVREIESNFDKKITDIKNLFAQKTTELEDINAEIYKEKIFTEAKLNQTKSMYFTSENRYIRAFDSGIDALEKFILLNNQEEINNMLTFLLDIAKKYNWNENINIGKKTVDRWKRILSQLNDSKEKSEILDIIDKINTIDYN